ncbi:Peroxidase, family 2-domain-containing protein [Xylariaceae sp. FL0016]|nr:Peroxidase, family 2-domain-containing protein [Xylariaceae sp. FL0016]
MKSALFLTALAFGLTNGQSYSQWSAPGPNDARAPCPMLNTLANHGFLPHDGKNLKETEVVDALATALNFDAELSKLLFSFAVTTNPTPNATTFSLNDLGRHDILEHDASLSRTDAAFGDPIPFNETVFNQTRQFWTGDIIDLQMAANARAARLMISNLSNPDYTLSSLGSEFSIGETAAYVAILGDRVSGTVAKERVEYLFENERLPLELGWVRPCEAFTETDLGGMMDRVASHTSYPPQPPADGSTDAKKRAIVRGRGAHGGY